MSITNGKDSENIEFEEVYIPDHDGQVILMDPVHHVFLLKKTLEYYDIRVFAWLKEHPDIHIPKISRYEETDGKLTVYEEYIQGMSLKELMEKEELPLARRKEIFEEILEGVQYLHSANPPIIHRDIKAENILIANDGTVKIIDYDAAKVYRANGNKDTVLIGTEGVAAPEQYGFGQSDERTDIYALGVLMKEMFKDDPAILETAAKATMMDPSDRQQSVQELYADFRHPKQSWLKYLPPAFRSGSIVRMIICVCWYLFIFTVALSMDVKDANGNPEPPALLWSERFMFVGIMVSLTDLFTHWTHIYDSFPLLRHEKRYMRILGYIIMSILIILFWIFILVFLIAVFTFIESRK